MKHLKPARRREGIRRRTIDESTVVEVNKWPLPGKRNLYGVWDFHASSCNVCGNCASSDRWHGSTVEAIHDRLTFSDGLAKGRVIFALGEDWMDGVTSCAVLLYHVPRQGVVKVLRVDTANDVWAERRPHFFAALLACAESIAREGGEGRRARLEWTLKRRDLKNDVCARFQFQEAGRDRDGYHLVRTATFT
jgi:hypothetical protein